MYENPHRDFNLFPSIQHPHNRLTLYYKIFSALPRGPTTHPPGSFIKFTTNLLSAAIKDAVFVGAAFAATTKFLLEERKAHFAPSRPTQTGLRARCRLLLPSPAWAAPALARWRLLPNFPQRFPAPIPIRQRERRRERERREASVGRSVGLMRRQRPIERTAVVVVVRALFPSVRSAVAGAMGITATDRPFAR